MAFSKTIQMYIFDGNPNGRIMCELSNWNGRIYKIFEMSFQNLQNEMIRKTLAYTSYSVKMKAILTRSM